VILDVAFPEAIPLVFRDEVERQIFYLSDRIDRFDLVVEGGRINGIRVQVDTPGVDLGPVAARIRRVQDRFSERRPFVRPERVWTHTVDRTIADDTFERMRVRGIVHQPAAGLVAVDESFMRLADYLDATMVSVVKERFGAAEYRYPTLIPTEVMRRGGYLRSFPHMLMFVTRLHGDADVYADASEASVEAQLEGLLRHYTGTALCLPPTMCYHTYAQLADAAVPAGGRVFTAKGKSFRFESKYERNLERLWDFTIREIVFVGTGPAVGEQRAQLMHEICRLAERWDLSGFCETANDPFFTEDDGKNNSFAQRLLSLKYELRLDVGRGRTIAVASFNRHNDFLGDAYRIRIDGGGTAHTACAGIGLERLAFVFFCQHGLDPAHWPAEVRAATSAAGRA
jgi:seryl-tRNA synthetase